MLKSILFSLGAAALIAFVASDSMAQAPNGIRQMPENAPQVVRGNCRRGPLS